MSEWLAGRTIDIRRSPAEPDASPRRCTAKGLRRWATGGVWAWPPGHTPPIRRRGCRGLDHPTPSLPSVPHSTVDNRDRLTRPYTIHSTPGHSGASEVPKLSGSTVVAVAQGGDMFARLGQFVVSHRWWVIVAWLAAAVAAIAFSPRLTDITEADQGNFLPD